MRYGFTTGSCAAAAAKAAAYMLLTGKEKKEITIETPKGILYHAKICDPVRGETKVSCAVQKDGMTRMSRPGHSSMRQSRFRTV